MDLPSVLADVLWGWGIWSLAHNVGHRWWHVEMRQGKKTPYAHGEREHHRVYDPPVDRGWQVEEDPRELFISFPLFAIAPFGLIVLAAFGWIRGWEHCLPFGAALYVCMVGDHQLHILFHKSPQLSGPLGWLQRMHLIHHGTHHYNYFFVTGFIWDVLFRSMRTKLEAERQKA